MAEAQAVVPQDAAKDLWNKLLATLNDMVELDKHLLFVEPVQESYAPNYYTIIKEPMDFSTMYCKILDEEYSGWDDFTADFELMCANALTYNAKTSKVHSVAAKLRDAGRRILQQAQYPPLEARPTLAVTHAECANHITPGGLGREYYAATAGRPKRGQPTDPESSAAPPQEPEDGSTTPEPAAPENPVPEQPSRILVAWATLQELQRDLKAPLLECQELTTSPTMNAALDEQVSSAAALQEASTPRPVLGRGPSMPLLSRTATMRSSVAEALQLDVGGGPSTSPLDEESFSTKRRRPSMSDWEEFVAEGAEDSLPLKRPRLELERSNSSSFLLMWVQPAVQQIHSARYLERIAKEVERLRAEDTPKQPRRMFRCVSLTQRGDTFISSRSLHAALCASYTVCRAIDQVMSSQYRNAFCCIRPPGHHAGPDGSTVVVDQEAGAVDTEAKLVGQGFCLINHVAVGARYALNNYAVSRVAIIDWDLHHGNGTEACCLERSKLDASTGMPDMLFCSIHGATSEGSSSFALFPGTATKAQIDLKKGLVNIPLPYAAKSSDYLDAFKNTLCKAVKDYNPDLIMISAGFDAHKDDMFQFLRLSDASYRQMTQAVMDVAQQVCNGRVVSVLEGGYTITTLAQCCKLHVKTLATYNQPAVKESKKAASSSGSAGLRKLKRLRSSGSSANSLALSSDPGSPAGTQSPSGGGAAVSSAGPPQLEVQVPADAAFKVEPSPLSPFLQR